MQTMSASYKQKQWQSEKTTATAHILAFCSDNFHTLLLDILLLCFYCFCFGFLLFCLQQQAEYLSFNRLFILLFPITFQFCCWLRLRIYFPIAVFPQTKFISGFALKSFVLCFVFVFGRFAFLAIFMFLLLQKINIAHSVRILSFTYCFKANYFCIPIFS